LITRLKSKASSKPPASAKPKRPASARLGREQGRPGAALSRERIAAAALALVDREGLTALSTRRLGDELGCEAMSIYHHFPSKAHLMDALVDLMLAEARVAGVGEGDWLERLRRTAHSFRAMALKHPKFFPFFAVHRLNTRAGVAFVDGVIGILREAGFSDGGAARYFREIGYHLVGALDETAGYARPVSGRAGRRDHRRDSNTRGGGALTFSPHFQATFETGLEMLLEGISRAHGDRT
jgi:AcrR family transcriptional regulator